MNSFIIQCIICGAIPLLAIPINLIICKYLIFKEIQTEQVNNEENAESNRGVPYAVLKDKEHDSYLRARVEDIGVVSE